MCEQKNRVIIQTRLQTIFNYKTDNELDQKFYELIVSHAINAEKSGPGGFDLCISFILDGLECLARGDAPRDRVAELRAKLKLGFSQPTLDDIIAVIDHYGSLAPKSALAMLKESLALAGFGGRILIEKSTVPSIELVRGYTFNVKTGIDVTTRLEKPKVIIIDGFIESVSEIHHLLHAANESHDSVLLFCRGAADDVFNTLKINFDRGTLRVIPIVVQFDLNGINTLKDVAIITGNDVITSLKGETLSNIKYANCASIKRALVYPTKVVLSDSSMTESIKRHVFDLQKRQREQSIVDGSKLYDDRIRSLSPNHVVIRLVDDKDYVVSSQMIDYTLRAIKALTDQGMLKGFDLPVTVPPLTSTISGAVINSDRCMKVMQSLGAAVLS